MELGGVNLSHFGKNTLQQIIIYNKKKEKKERKIHLT